MGWSIEIHTEADLPGLITHLEPGDLQLEAEVSIADLAYEVPADPVQLEEVPGT